MIQQVQVTHAKKKSRSELRLPQLHFIATDNWIPEIGDRAFCAWLTLYSWADRSDSERDFDAVPRSMKAIQKKLGVAPATFYNTIIRPLWNYGFIDLIEHDGNGTSTTINIVIYEYPFNDIERSTKPLEKLRDYDTEYQSKGKERIHNAIEKSSSKIEQEINVESCSKIEQASSSKIEQENEKASSNFEHNNVLNNSFNVLNSNNNTETDVVVDRIHNQLKNIGVATTKGSVKLLLSIVNGDVEYIQRLMRYAAANGLGFGWIKKQVENGEDIIEDLVTDQERKPNKYDAFYTAMGMK